MLHSNVQTLPLCLLVFLCQTRGNGNFRESRGLSSSTVELYSGNWASGGQSRTLARSLLRLASLSHKDYQQHYQTSSGSPTTFLWPKDPFSPRLGPKDVFSHQNMLVYFQFQRQIAVCFSHHVRNSAVVSVPPKCGQQSIPHLSVFKNHCDSVHFDSLCCHNVTFSWFISCLSSCAIYYFFPPKKQKCTTNRSVAF